MLFDKSGMYPKVSVANFDDQKYQSRAQKYALIAHAYLCLVALFVVSPILKAFDYIREYTPSNAPRRVNAANWNEAYLLRPFGAVTLSKIYNALAHVWNLMATPFRYVSDALASTDSLKLKLEDKLKMALDIFDKNK
jgi:hypothetical protein